MNPYIPEHILTGHIGLRLKWLRVNAKVSQARVAERMGLSQARISQYETRGDIPQDLIISLAYLFAARIDWLSFGEGKPR